MIVVIKIRKKLENDNEEEKTEDWSSSEEVDRDGDEEEDLGECSVFGVVELKGKRTVAEVPPGPLINRYKTFHYQVTPIRGFAPIFVKREMKNRRFMIGTEKDTVGVRVHWEVRGDELRANNESVK